MCVCVSEHVGMNALSPSDVGPKTTFLPSDLRLFCFLRYFRNFFPSHLRNRFSQRRSYRCSDVSVFEWRTWAKSGRKHTFSKTGRKWVQQGCGERKKMNLTWQQRWHRTSVPTFFVLFYIFYRADMSSSHCNIKSVPTSWIWGVKSSAARGLIPVPVGIFSLWKAPVCTHSPESFACV